MADAPAPSAPSWALKRDGRKVPFEPDKISRSLFAAAEALGRPDPFLARELADAVVHFLAADGEDAPATTQIAEMVAKVVRELGHPALASAFLEGRHLREQGPHPLPLEAPEIVVRVPAGAPLTDVLAACRRQWALQSIFTRDLVAAQSAGLLTLTGLDAPDQLAGQVLVPVPGSQRSLSEQLEELRAIVASTVVLDGPEHALIAWGHGPEGVPGLVADLIGGLRRTGLHAVVNLNASTPPPWAEAIAPGPLFDRSRSAGPREGLDKCADLLVQALLSAGDNLRVDWHVGERDVRRDAAPRLEQVARLALGGAPVGFVFDRPRRPVVLAEGMDRQHGAVLMMTGVSLPRLAEQPGAGDGPEPFLRKLGSLARLALSAAVQKRDYLRKQERARAERSGQSPALTSGFLLDRARLVVAPLGLEAMVQRFLGRGLSSGGAAVDLGRQIVLRLRDVLARDGGALHLDTCIDGPWAMSLNDDNTSPTDIAGLTPWSPASPLKAQLRAGGSLHGAAEAGTLALFPAGGDEPSPTEVADSLRAARQQPDIVRVRLMLGQDQSGQSSKTK